MRIVASSQDTTILLMQNWPSPPRPNAELIRNQTTRLPGTVLFACHSGAGDCVGTSLDCACTTLTSSPISASVSV